MTTACAWCGAITNVDLAALWRSGLSHGICEVCMPRVFGQRAYEAYKASVYCEKSCNFSPWKLQLLDVVPSPKLQPR